MLKTHSGAKKRFRSTSSGKIKYQKSFKRHLLCRKKVSRKRDLGRCGYISASDSKHIEPLLSLRG